MRARETRPKATNGTTPATSTSHTIDKARTDSLRSISGFRCGPEFKLRFPRGGVYRTLIVYYKATYGDFPVIQWGHWQFAANSTPQRALAGRKATIVPSTSFIPN